jgi:hypothetical protein
MVVTGRPVWPGPGVQGILPAGRIRRAAHEGPNHDVVRLKAASLASSLPRPAGDTAVAARQSHHSDCMIPGVRPSHKRYAGFPALHRHGDRDGARPGTTIPPP